MFVELFTKAYNLYKEGKFDEAQNILTQAEEVYEPNENGVTLEDVNVLRGVIALDQEDVEYALEAFQRALEENPNSVEACLGLGQIFFIVDMKEEAKKMFEWAVKNGPENLRAIAALTNINKHLGYPPEHNSLNEEGENNDERFFDEAYSLFINNKFPEALEKLNEITDTENEDVLLLKGNIFLADNDLERAKDIFEKILGENPKSVPAFIGLAEYFYKKGMKTDSKTMYEQALKISPDDEYALVGLAKVNQELGFSPVHNLRDVVGNTQLSERIDAEFSRAFEKFQNKEFNEAIEILSNLEKEIEEKEIENKNGILSRIKNFIGFNYLSLNNLSKAQESFEKSLELNPDSSQACAGLGEVFYLTGNDKQSKIMYEWAVKNNFENAFAVAGLAKVNKALGLPADHNTLKLGIDIDDSVEFNALITEAYEMFMKKDFSGAIENLKKAEKFYDAEPEVREAKIALASILNFQGYCYLGLNDLENAREVFEKALVLNPESSQACAGLGEIFYLLEQDENAKIMYEWALRNEPGNQFAVAGLEKVGNATETENPEVTAQTEEDEEIMTAAEKIENLIEEAYNDFAIKEFREAIAKLEEAEKLVNETFEEQDKTFALSSINNFLGFNYLGIQENEKAKEHFEKSINYNSETAQGYAGLGTVNYLLGNDEEAKRLLEKSLKINPQNKYALGELIKVNRALGLEDDDNENV